MQPPYFIGIDIPEDITKTISSTQTKFYDPNLMRQPLTPHITLLHPPSLKTVPYQHLLPQVKMHASSYLPLQISLGGVEKFHNSTLYIGIESPKISKLHKELVGLLPSATQAQYYTGKVFLSHITILQSTNLNIFNEQAEREIAKELAGLAGRTFTITNLTLYRQKATRQYEQRDI